MKKRILILRIFAAAMSVVMMILIFNFSADNAQESGQKSAEITEKIVQTVDPEIVKKPIEEQRRVYESVGAYVRKSAHFLEFAALGFFLSLMVNTIYPDFLRRFFIRRPACAPLSHRSLGEGGSVSAPRRRPLVFAAPASVKIRKNPFPSISAVSASTGQVVLSPRPRR